MKRILFIFALLSFGAGTLLFGAGTLLFGAGTLLFGGEAEAVRNDFIFMRELYGISILLWILSVLCVIAGILPGGQRLGREIGKAIPWALGVGLVLLVAAAVIAFIMFRAIAEASEAGFL